MVSRVPSPGARVRFAASRPCAVRRGRAVLVAVGVAGGFWLPAASAPVSGLSVLAFLGVSCGCSFSRCGSARFAGSPRRALVALAGRVGAVVWRAALARSGVGAVVFRCGGRRRVPVGLGGGGVRGGLVGLGRVPARRAAVRGSGVRRLRAGGRAAVACGWRRLRRRSLGRGAFKVAGVSLAALAPGFSGSAPRKIVPDYQGVIVNCWVCKPGTRGVFDCGSLHVVVYPSWYRNLKERRDEAKKFATAPAGLAVDRTGGRHPGQSGQ